MYQRLEAALSSLIGGEKPIKGTLGYTIDGAYRVTVAEDAAKFYVRFADGSFAQVYHRGRASPVPDLPVEVGYDSAGNMVIVGGDPDRAGLFDGAHEVGPHSHARESGMEFAIDPRLLTPIKAAPLNGLTVYAAQGAYRHDGALRWWGGGAITLTPPGSANTWAWVVIGLDAAAETLVAASGTAIVVSAPLEPSTIPAIPLAGAIPLAAVRLRNGQTELDEADFEDLRYPLSDEPAALDDLSDVDTSGAADGEVLTYASGTWTPQAPAAPNGDLPAFGAGVSKTLSGDTASAGSDRHLVLSAETGTADDLIEITGLSAGDEVILRAAAGHTITVKHNDGSATDKIILYNGADIALSGDKTMKLVKTASGTVVQYVDEQGAGGGSGDGTWTSIGVVELSSNAASIVFSSIPSDFDHLVVKYRLRSDRTSNTSDGVLVEYNGDTTTADYSVYGYEANLILLSGNSRGGGRCTTSTSNANEMGYGEIWVEWYGRTDRWKNGRSQSGVGASQYLLKAITTWKNTAAITQITLKPQIGSNFVAGSVVELIGVKAA